MKDFEYIDPGSLDDAVLLAGKEGWAETERRFIAGGQDLYAELKTGLVEAEGLVNLKALHANQLAGMGVLEEQGQDLYVGSLITLRQLERLEGDGAAQTLLREAAASVASPQVRTRATVGGNLCQRPRCLYYRRPELVCLKKGGFECFARSGHNKYNAILGGGPSYIVHPSDLAPALVALDAELYLHTPQGMRTLTVDDFYTLPESSDVTRETVAGPADVVTGVRTRLPSGPEWRATYVKFKERTGFDFALSAVALALAFDGRTVVDARLAFGGVAPKPWRVDDEATEPLLGLERGADGRRLQKVSRAVGDAALRWADPLEMNAYKVPLTKGLIHKAISNLISP